MTQITNGQFARASWDLFDQRSKPITQLPAGAVVTVTGGDAGGPSGVAQWRPDADPENGHGTITTEGDNLGPMTFNATLTLPDGTVKQGNPIEVEVINSAPGEFIGTVSTPEDEVPPTP